MKTAKNIWNNDNLRCGGFYELAIEVSDNHQNRKQIESFIKSFFKIGFIEGPFDNEFNPSDFFINTEKNYGEALGFLEIENKQIPFKTIFISEEGEKGSNWVDICFYTAIYEKILGEKYQTWAKDGNCHEGFDELLIKVLRYLNSRYKIRLGIIGFEVSGMYYLKTLKEKKLDRYDISHTKFFVNKNEKLKDGNWEKVNEL